MLHSLKQQATFIRQFGTRFETTGSLIPSSRFLAHSITRYLQDRGDGAIRVLECGPGTGPFTDRIVRRLRPGDTYHLVELNEHFVQLLRERFAEEPHWQEKATLVQIFELPLQDFAPDEKYDFIISGLPHINFPGEVVQKITDSYFRLLKPGGVLSYFEYMYIRPVRKMITLGSERRRVREIDAVLEGHCRRHRIRRDTVLANVPPAWVQHLRMDAAV